MAVLLMRNSLFILLLLGISACGETAKPQAPRPEMLARALCNCSAPLLELNRQAATNSDSLAFRKIAAEFDKARRSVQALNIKPEEQAELSQALKQLCPDLAREENLLTELLAQ